MSNPNPPVSRALKLIVMLMHIEHIRGVQNLLLLLQLRLPRVTNCLPATIATIYSDTKTIVVAKLSLEGVCVGAWLDGVLVRVGTIHTTT